MSQSSDFFKGDLAKLEGFDLESPLGDLKAQACVFYFDKFGNASKQAAAKDDAQTAAVYRFLSVITGFHETFDTPNEPYSSMATGPDWHSPTPRELSPTDWQALEKLTPLAKDPTLRARLYDVLWLHTRKPETATEAVKAYLAAAQIQNQDDNWLYAVASFKRALYLAGALGRAKPFYKEVLIVVEAAAKAAANDQSGFRACKLLRILCHARSSDPAIFVPIVSAFAERMEAKSDYYAAKIYRELQVEWLQLTGDRQAIKAAKLAAAENAVKKAERRAVGADASGLAASALMVEAIEGMKRAGAPVERISELRKRLAEFQGASLEEMQTFSTTIDISQAVKGAEQHVKSPDFRIALAKLAMGATPCEPQAIRKEVLEIAKENPLTHLFGSALLDSKGRTKAIKEGVLGASGEAAETALLAEMFSHASQFHWTFRVDGYIEPARIQIFNDHHPSFDDLAPLLLNNPFVPPGHQGIYLRGLQAGFCGDFLVAAHLLTPQIENSIRYVFESQGIDVSVFKSDGTQPVKILGGLLLHPEAIAIFGAGICFELQGCLVEKTGFDFRTRVAHGFVSEEECFSPAAVMVWWLALRLCFLPQLYGGKFVHPETDTSNPRPVPASPSP